VVQDKVLPPGPYTIEEHRGASKTNVVHIFSDGGMRLEATVQTIPAMKNRTPSDTSVILNRFGDRYYIDKVWIQGKDYGYQFREPESIRSLERERYTSASLPARYFSASTEYYPPELADQRQPLVQAAANRVVRTETVTTVTSTRYSERISREARHELVMLPYY